MYMIIRESHESAQSLENGSTSSLAMGDSTVIEDAAAASNWLREHPDAAIEDRHHLVTICELIENDSKKGNKKEWHNLLTVWKNHEVPRNYKNKQDQWRNRALPDIKCDLQNVLLKRVQAAAQSFYSSDHRQISSGASSPSASSTAAVHGPQNHESVQHKSSASSGTLAENPIQQEIPSSHAQCETKRLASVLEEETAGKCSTDLVCKNSERNQRRRIAASASNSGTMKRKKADSGTCDDWGEADTQHEAESRTSKSVKANKTKLSVENWADLHELDSWLSTEEAKRLRKNEISGDRSAVQCLLAVPPNRADLKIAADRLQLSQRRQSLSDWHYIVAQEMLQCYKRWRRADAFANWRQEGPNQLPNEPRVAGMPSVQSIEDIKQREEMWWMKAVTQSFRKFTGLRSEHPEIMEQHEWHKLETRFGGLMRCTRPGAIRTLLRNQRDFLHDASVSQTRRQPLIGDNHKSSRLKETLVHFSLSSWLTNQVEQLEAKAENQSSASSPGQNMEPRGTTENPSRLPGGKTTSKKQDVPRQTLQAFFDLCKSAPHDLPYSLFGDSACSLNAPTSQAMRQLLICSL